MAEFKTVFASGQAGEADAAYTIAEKNLWAKVKAIPGAQVRSIQHATATRTVITGGLNIERWATETREVSEIIVTLLASVAVEGKGTK